MIKLTDIPSTSTTDCILKFNKGQGENVMLTYELELNTHDISVQKTRMSHLI